jgi:uncharacterized protein (DUF433 family)
LEEKKRTTSGRKESSIYSVEDIAAILHLPQPQVKRWLKEYKLGKLGVYEAENDHSPDLVTDFYTLIEFYTFYQLRALGVMPGKINKARGVLSDMLHTPHPFATANILTDGRNVFFNAEVGQLIKADQTLQLFIQQVVEPFCKRIEFGDDSLPIWLYPMGRESSILIDPNRQSGRPVVGESNTLSKTVFDAFLKGNSVSALAERFNLTKKEVEDVIKFHEQ